MSLTVDVLDDGLVGGNTSLSQLAFIEFRIFDLLPPICA
jgi:hypothetical protein